MADMVERVARAIFGAWAADVGSSHSWEDLKQATAVASEDEVPTLHRMQRQAYAEARAAIEAMREPSEAMLERAVPEPVHLYEGRDADYQKRMQVAVKVDRLVAIQRHRAMIDAALASERKP